MRARLVMGSLKGDEERQFQVNKKVANCCEYRLGELPGSGNKLQT